MGTFEANDHARMLINRILDSGRVSYGPLSKQFEKDFAALHGAKYGVLSNSGTSSLQVALQAMKEIHGWSDGDEVIVPATTFVATANVVLHNRLTPVLVDVEPVTYNINPSMVSAAITDKTRAIIPVHLFGQPANMTGLRKVIDGHDIKVVEDSCECMFATHAGTSVGTLGDIGCFSTYVAHLVTTGVGGISITNNPDYAKKMRSLVNHGRDGIYISFDDDSGDEEVIERRFHFESVGHSFRVTEFEAALGLSQIQDGVWQEMIATRRRNASRLLAALQPVKGKLVLPKVGKKNSHSWMMFPIVVRDDSKWPLVKKLEAAGVETREMLPLINQPIYQNNPSIKMPYGYPVSEWLIRGGFYVGCHQGLTLDDMEYMAEVVLLALGSDG